MKKLLLLSVLFVAGIFSADFVQAVSCPEINRTTHPSGLKYAAFNCFTDNNKIGQYYGGDQREQNFIRVKETGGTWGDSVSNLSDGDQVEVLFWIHNSGEEGVNSYAAQNTNIDLDWGNPASVSGSISASNTNPSQVDDTTSIQLGLGQTITPLDILATYGTISLSATASSHSFGPVSYPSSYSYSQGLIFRFRVNGNPPVTTNPSIHIDKNDADNTDDTQTVISGGTATFTIRVTNNGDEALNNVVITDAEAPSCARTAAETAVLYSGGNSADFDPDETFTYTCTAANVTDTTFADGDNDISVQGTGVTSGTDVTDEDPTTIIVEPSAEISVTKDDNDNLDDTQTVISGGTANFTITVTNNGNVALQNIVLTDAATPNCDRNTAQTNAMLQGIGNNDTTFDVGETFSYNCEQINVTADYINTIVVTGTPTNGAANVTDNDPTTIIVNPDATNTPSINIVKDDNDNTDDTQASQNGTATFTITVTNDGQVDLTNVALTDVLAPNCAGNFTAPNTGAATWTNLTTTGDGDANFEPGESFTFNCTDTGITQAYTNLAAVSATGNGQVVNDDDTSVVTVTTTTSSSPSGGSETSPIAQACTSTNNPNNPLQCRGVKLNDLRDANGNRHNDDEYQECLQNGNKNKQQCANEWAERLGYDVSACNNINEDNPCDIPIPTPLEPTDPTDDPCASCFGATIDVEKKVKNDNTAESFSEKTSVAATGEAKYKLTLTNVLHDTEHYTINGATVTFYDYTVPAESGSLWFRKGITDGWNANNTGGLQLSKAFNKTQLNELNNGGNQISVEYIMDASLADNADIARAIKNVAFAKIVYDYTCNNCGKDGGSTTGRGTRLVNYESSFTSLGSSATVDIIRPFYEATNGGSVGLALNPNDRIVGTKNTITNVGATTGYSAENVDTLKLSEATKNRYGLISKNTYDTKNTNKFGALNADTNLSVGSDGNILVLKNGDLTIDGDLNMGGSSKTFIIENGNLIIKKTFSVSDGFVAFIIRGGEIQIDKDVTSIEGVFIAEGQKVVSTDNKQSNKQLTVHGSLIGDLENLLENRNFIGVNPANVIEPNIKFLFDNRILEETPPGLEDFLGNSWGQQ